MCYEKCTYMTKQCFVIADAYLIFKSLHLLLSVAKTISYRVILNIRYNLLTLSGMKNSLLEFRKTTKLNKTKVSLQIATEVHLTPLSLQQTSYFSAIFLHQKRDDGLFMSIDRTTRSKTLNIHFWYRQRYCLVANVSFSMKIILKAKQQSEQCVISWNNYAALKITHLLFLKPKAGLFARSLQFCRFISFRCWWSSSMPAASKTSANTTQSTDQ